MCYQTAILINKWTSSNWSGAVVAEYEEVQIPNKVSATNDQSYQCDEDLTMTECAAYGHFEN